LLAGRTSAPGIEATSRDMKNTTHEIYWKYLQMSRNEHKSQVCSLAKQALAFFRISRSMSRRRFSSRS
jgi:hypothetical protein